MKYVLGFEVEIHSIEEGVVTPMIMNVYVV